MNNTEVKACSIIGSLILLAIIKIYFQVRSIKKHQQRFREKL